MNMIKCADCSGEKPPESYPKRSGRGTRRGICRSCLRVRKRLKANAITNASASSGQAAATLEGASQTVTQALYMDERAAEAVRAFSEIASSREREAEPERGPHADRLPVGEAPDADRNADAARDIESDIEADEAPSKRKRNRNRSRNRRKKAKAGTSADPAANVSDELSDGTPLNAATGSEPADEELVDRAEEPQAEADSEDEKPRKKRKRRRKRSGKAKKAIAGGEFEPVSEAADVGVSAEQTAYHATEPTAAEQQHQPAAAADSIADSTSDEDEDEDEELPGKRKRKRKRKRGKKAKKVRTASALGEPPYDGDAADRTSGGVEDSAANNVHDADAEPANATELTDSSDDSGEKKRAKRKRKRKRRRKGKRAAENETEALEPKRPAVRPPDKKIVPFKGPFGYDSSFLNDKGTGMIRLRGRRETGKRWHTEIEKEIAVRMVNEGAAGIIHPRLIHKLYTKSDFRLLILQRDNYVCRYCGRFGDTIDHVMPKSKGGLSSPLNCVCACSECNLLKADKLDFPFPDEWDE